VVKLHKYLRRIAIYQGLRQLASMYKNLHKMIMTTKSRVLKQLFFVTVV